MIVLHAHSTTLASLSSGQRQRTSLHTAWDHNWLRQKQPLLKLQRCSATTVALYQSEVAGSWVVALAAGRPRGTVHFLGGVFAGAAPGVAYALLLQLLAEAGYTCVATPYAVTFQHLACAAAVHQKFEACVGELRASGQGFLVPEDRGMHGVGHSNGALLHLLIGATAAPPNASNVLLSFNNKPVSDAIPVPLDGLRQAVTSARSQPWAADLPSPSALLASASGLAAAAGVPLNEAALRSLVPAVDQLASVFSEVGNGQAEFTPTPAEGRALIASGYRTPFTMLVRFENDAIDETPAVADVLQRTNPAGTTTVTLPGTHLTPCGGDVSWPAGRGFSAVDVLAAGARAVAQADIRRLAARVVAWLDSRR